MRRPRRYSWRRVLSVLTGALLVVVAVLATSSGAVAAGDRAIAAIPSTNGTKPINGVPDVTGAGNPHGSVSLASLRKSAPGTVITASSVQIDGLARGYLVIAPAGLTGPLPLIVVIGGVTASPTQEADRDELMPIVERGGAILVYPAGYGESWNVGVGDCCGPAAAVGVDDEGFIRAVTLAVQASRAVSASYLVGFSNGGKLAYQVICDEPGLFSSVAIVGATPLTSCPTDQPRRILIVVGAKDPELPAQGHTQPVMTVFNAALSTWRQYDSCATTSSQVGVSLALATTWSNCASGTEVVGLLYGGLDHEWPTTAIVGANIAGATLIWAFLTGHPVLTS